MAFLRVGLLGMIWDNAGDLGDFGDFIRGVRLATRASLCSER